MDMQAGQSFAVCMCIPSIFKCHNLFDEIEAPVAHSVKRWLTDLAVLDSSPTQGEIFSTVNEVPLHTEFHYHPSIILI